IVAWAEKFRFEQVAAQEIPRSWVLDLFRRARVFGTISAPFARLIRFIAVRRLALPQPVRRFLRYGEAPQVGRVVDGLWLLLVLAATAGAIWQIGTFVHASLTLGEIGYTVLLGAATLLRVIVLIALATVIWVPIGVWIGLRPSVAQKVQPIAQILAAFPVNLVFP